MHSRRSHKGFTLAEMLIVIGIIAVLAAVAFIGIMSYLRGMTKLEYDGYAREIFVAAQNHLSMAQSQGYLGRTDFGVEEKDEHGNGTGVYYFVVAENHAETLSSNSVLNLMLPMAAVDENLRLGGSYIVRYHKDSGQVLDVFYWSQTADRFRHSYSGEYADFLSKREDKNALKTYESDRSVIGYYGGVEAESLTHGSALTAPLLLVKNAETLTAVVTDPNSSDPNARLKLVITGVTSRNSRELPLSPTTALANVSYDAHEKRYTVTLDDITVNGQKFHSLFGTGADPLIPGENLVLQAVAYNNTELTNIAYSAERATNSLFADGTDLETAKIGYFRHLENLDNHISDLSYSVVALVHITKAEQITDMTWSGFTGAADAGCAYLPVSPAYGLEYDGQGHSIRALAVTETSTGNAGVFGSLTGAKLSNLKLTDCSVTSEDGNAGALAGSVTGTVVENVLAVNSGSGASPTVTGTGSVGGLIGSVSGGSVSGCAAALAVSGGSSTGGLIGTAESGASISACYAGGHTTNGKYGKTVYNVTGSGAAGGLIGTLRGSAVEYSYATCSARGGTAGGLIGTGTDSASITSCYATGLVKGTTQGAFAGLLAGTATDCHYFRIINERDAEGGEDGSKGYEYLKAVNDADRSGIAALDGNRSGYNAEAGSGSASAVPYDSLLNLYYQGKFNLKSVVQLGGTVASGGFVATHYGDWPAPETWVVNR